MNIVAKKIMFLTNIMCCSTVRTVHRPAMSSVTVYIVNIVAKKIMFLTNIMCCLTVRTVHRPAMSSVTVYNYSEYRCKENNVSYQYNVLFDCSYCPQTSHVLCHCVYSEYGCKENNVSYHYTFFV